MKPEYCDSKCQSNCQQPGPTGDRGSSVQNRVIGYYEAWAHSRKCSGMDFENIPVDGLTHLYFSFGYISPGNFEVVPMNGGKDGNLESKLFSEFSAVKKKNSNLKTVVALGGWTFNDNGTSTQPGKILKKSHRTVESTYICDFTKLW
jgi:chitinase